MSKTNILLVTKKINLIFACLEHLADDKLNEIAEDTLNRAERSLGIGVPLQDTYNSLEAGLKAIIDCYGYTDAVETLKQVKALK